MFETDCASRCEQPTGAHIAGNVNTCTLKSCVEVKVLFSAKQCLCQRSQPVLRKCSEELRTVRCVNRIDGQLSVHGNKRRCELLASPFLSS